jgi:hypothetical protein
MDEWKNNLCYIHTMEYGSAMKKNEILIHAPTWMTHENMLIERSHRQKATYRKSPSI